MESGAALSYALEQRDNAAKQEFWACLALRETPGVGMRRVSLLLSHFGSAYDAVQNRDAWPEAGVSAALGKAFGKESWRQKAYAEWKAVGASPCEVTLWADAHYPAWLRSIPDAPPFLYSMGDLSLLRNLCIAVVGMRSCTEEGLKSTIVITRGLAKAGVTIVSGMAKGVDRAAHLAGLEGVGRSIGVLGAGIDVEYPPGNKDLYALMREKGLLVSEMPPGFGVEGRFFPVRNRIISGLSRAVVVVEAATRSGSLNTAGHALEQNRELMAVPGAVTAETAKGCQELVRRGAKAVFCADDVLRELAPQLSEHVARGVEERDLARFQWRGKTKQTDSAAEADGAAHGNAESFPAVLPWRAAPGKKERAAKREGANARQEATACAAGAPQPAALDENAQDTRRDMLDGSRNAACADLRPVGVAREVAGLTEQEAAVYALLRSGSLHIDDICRGLGQDVGVISGVMAVLEVRGVVSRLPGMAYAICDK